MPGGRRRAAAWILAGALVAGGCEPGPVPRDAGASHAGFEKGVIFGLFARSRPSYARRSLDEIRALGATAVAIMVPWVTPNVFSSRMAPRGDMTPSDRSLRRAIRMARRRDLQVFLMPFLYVDDLSEGQWRGTIDPPDWNAWFDNYARFVLHYAVLSEEEGVDLLSVGSELCSTETRRDDWVRLIGNVRKRFTGRITYSANWDHRDSLSFADRLDVLGMNAYFQLSDSGTPGIDELVDAWQPIVREIEAWRARWDKDLIVTEVGYPSRRGAGVDPWNHEVSRGPAPQEQYRCYRAFERVWRGNPHLKGVYFYHWWGDGGPADIGYTPRGKPAEQVLRDWFGG